MQKPDPQNPGDRPPPASYLLQGTLEILDSAAAPRAPALSRCERCGRPRPRRFPAHEPGFLMGRRGNQPGRPTGKLEPANEGAAAPRVRSSSLEGQRRRRPPGQRILRAPELEAVGDPRGWARMFTDPSKNTNRNFFPENFDPVGFWESLAGRWRGDGPQRRLRNSCC